jgi:hypothetical protein
MIVVGINIALWFEGKFEDIKDAESEQQYLQGLHDDLKVDVARLKTLITFNESKVATLGELMPRLTTLAQAQPEAIAGAIFEPSGYDFFQPADFTYRSMQESGDFRLLSDPETKEALLRLARRYREIELLQQNFIQALDDSYIPLMMKSFDIGQMRLADPDFLDNLIFRNFYAFTIQETEQRNAQCQNARDQAQALLEQIGAQIR